MAHNLYRPFPNTFRRDMLARKRLVGCWSSLASPAVAEVLGMVGFDWLLLDGEHTDAEIATFAAQLLSLRCSVSSPVVRPPADDPVVIKRVLDAGLHNLLLPFVQDADQARAAVAATRYPPHGVRGMSGSHRGNGFGTLADYYGQVNDNICVTVQIETPEAALAAAEIAAVDGVDGLFIGPSDLSASMGHICNPNHPEVQRMIAAVFAQAERAGKAAGILAPVEEDARRYFEMGATFVAVGIDQAILRQGAQRLHDLFMA